MSDSALNDRSASARELLRVARALAAEGAEIAVRMRDEGVDVAATKSSITDVVTRADRAVEDHIRKRLADLRPRDGFYGEEGDPAGGSSGLTWVVDPIDGTVNYLYDIPHWAVSVAVVEGDPAAEPAEMVALAGCVMNPRAGEEFAAAAGEGAMRNGRPLVLGNRGDFGDRDGRAEGLLAEALIATGYSYDAAERAAQAGAYARMAGRVRDVRRLGAASLDLCAVAAGRVDAYYEVGLKPWDHAAGALVAREAGATVSGLDGGREGRGGLVASRPGVQTPLLELLNEAQVGNLTRRKATAL